MTWRRTLLAWVAWLLYRLLSATWRIELVESEDLKRCLSQGQPVIFAHWHGDELAILPLVRHYRLATMTSTSKDGQLVDSVIRRFGGKTSKGSSTRGGIAALKGLVRLMKKDRHNASMAVDGPKGPIHQVKPGVFELSKLTRAPIVPTGLACSRTFIFKKSWNQAVLPKPFAKVVVLFGPTLAPLKKEDQARDPAWSTNLQRELFSARRQAAEKIAGPSAGC